MLQEKINQDLIQSMKSGKTNDKEVLSFLLSKVKNKAIELRLPVLSDADAILVIQKQIKELDEEIDMYTSAGRDATANLKKEQISILKSYLPKMLSEDEIRYEINALTDKSMPYIMKHFKMNFAGQVDMSLVSKVAREIK